MKTAPHRDRARGGLRQFRRVRVPQPRAVRLRRRRHDPVSRGHRARRGPAGAADPGGAAASARASSRSGPGTCRSTRWAGRRSSRSTTSRSWPPGPRRSSATSTPSWASSSPSCATEQLARPGQPQGEGPRRLPDDARGRPAAVHLHERRRPRLATCGPCSTKGATPSTPWPAAASRWRPTARARSSSARSPR